LNASIAALTELDATAPERPPTDSDTVFEDVVEEDVVAVALEEEDEELATEDVAADPTEPPLLVFDISDITDTRSGNNKWV
jgi:hypothetical protein